VNATEEELMKELDNVTRTPATHYYVRLTDKDTGLVARIDQTHQVTLRGTEAGHNVLRTKLNLYDPLKAYNLASRLHMLNIEAELIVDSGKSPDRDRAISQAIKYLRMRLKGAN